MDTGIEAVEEQETVDALREQGDRIGRRARMFSLFFALAVYLLKRIVA